MATAKASSTSVWDNTPCQVELTPTHSIEKLTGNGEISIKAAS
jgi:hypothetical protein